MDLGALSISLSATGPAHIALVEPDGNPVLIDQFF